MYKLVKEDSFAVWLAEAAEQYHDVVDLYRAFCDKLVSAGLPISRTSLGLETLHPQLSGWQVVWTPSEVRIDENERSADSATGYLASPARIVDETNKPFRRRLLDPSFEFPLLDDLKRAGATDYVIFPLPFIDQHRTAFLSFATTADSGFADREIVALHQAVRLLSPWVERQVLKRIAVNLLETYVGTRTGEHVCKGTIDGLRLWLRRSRLKAERS